MIDKNVTMLTTDEYVDRENWPNQFFYFLIFYSEIDANPIVKWFSFVEDQMEIQHFHINNEEIDEMLNYNPLNWKWMLDMETTYQTNVNERNILDDSLLNSKSQEFP